MDIGYRHTYEDWTYNLLDGDSLDDRRRNLYFFLSEYKINRADLSNYNEITYGLAASWFVEYKEYCRKNGFIADAEGSHVVTMFDFLLAIAYSYQECDVIRTYNVARKDNKKKKTTIQGMFWTICNILGLNKGILYLPNLETGHVNGDLKPKVYAHFKRLTEKEKQITKERKENEKKQVQ